MGDCTDCPHEGYCIPDDCELLKKKPPSVPPEDGLLQNDFHAYCSMGRRKKQ